VSAEPGIILGEAAEGRAKIATTGRVLEVRYEQLGREPEKVRNAVAEHLGVEAQGRFSRHFRTAHVNSVASYAKRDGGEIREAERIARAELELCGYL